MLYLKSILDGLKNQHFDKRTLRMYVGMLIFFALMFVNCFVYMSGAKEDEKEIVIVVDAGHGGNDPGKVSADGIMEKDVNLAIALKLKDKLEDKNIKVILTRDSDICLADTGTSNKKKSDMINRMEIVNDNKADLLISIHQNSYKDSSVKGAQVFYHGSSEQSKKVAQVVQGKIQEEIDNENNRKAKEANDYYILRKSVCPAIIIECGFLSNPEETSKLVDEKYQEKLAETIADAVCEIYDYNQ